MPTVAIVATLDTKGAEAEFLRQQITAGGCDVVVIDVGIKGESTGQCDVTRNRVAEAAGTTIESLIDADDRGQAVEQMGRGLAVLLPEMVRDGKVHAAIGLGGSGGTSIAATAFRALPVGFGKLIVSTLASGQTRPYVGTKDITMMFSVADLEGLNKISIPILTNAAAAVAAMATVRPPATETKPLIGMTMFGVTTPCVKQAAEILHAAGYETVVFHAVGTGGQAFETLIADGFFAGVLDLTTTEWCDQLVGGILSAGPTRLDAAAQTGTPQVVSVGALDMVNFGPKDSVPPAFKDRRFHIHNPQVTLMRTTVDENRRLGRILAEKLNATTGPTALLLPLGGVSAIDAPQQSFEDRDARTALFDSIRTTIDRSKVELIEVDAHINDPAFSQTAAEKLLAYL